MKVWIERNITSANNKKFLLVDVVEIISGKRFKIREENKKVTVEVVGCLNKGPISDTIENRVLLNEIRISQDKISCEFGKIMEYESRLERKTLEEINDDPNF